MARARWIRYLGLHVAGVVVVGVVAWMSPAPALIIGSAITVYALWQSFNVMRLFRWLGRTADDAEGARPPPSFGIWTDIYSMVDSIHTKNLERRSHFESMRDDFQSLTDAFPDATLVLDDRHNITWFNKPAGILLRLKTPEDLGRPVTNLLREPEFANWLDAEDAQQTHFEMASPRDENIWLNISSHRIQENQRLLLLRDVSELHNLDRIRRDFVANISHELRTPLTVLLGYLEMLQPESGDDDNAIAIERMYRQARQMQTMLDDLLELSRLQSGDKEGEDQAIDTPAMLAQLKEQAEELSAGKHRLEFDVDESLHLTGIAKDIESAFRNLIVNALLYTPQNGTIRVCWQAGENGTALFRVEDTGIGIPKRDIPRLTERFYRVGRDRARQTGGSGLGLAIVKHVLNAHQASLRIRSELGTGSEFVCEFPRNRVTKIFQP